MFDRVFAGESVHLADINLQLDRGDGLAEAHFAFSYTPARGESGTVSGLFGVCTETTAIVLGQRTLKFRLALDEQLRGLSDPRAIMRTACELLGRYLAAGRCGYGTVDETGNYFDIAEDWTDGVMPSLAGRLQLKDFGDEVVASFRAGKPVRIEDPLADTRTIHPQDAYAAIRDMRGGIAVPLLKDGRFAASIYVHQTTPRRWREEDEVLVREVGQLLWQSIERRRAEASLRLSEERYALALSAASAVGTWDWDVRADAVYADAQFANLYSVDPTRAANGVPIAEFMTAIHVDDRDRVGLAIREALGEAQPFESEYRVVRSDGSIVWVLARGRAYRDREGNPTRFPGVAVDITRRRQTEAHRQLLIDIADRWQDTNDAAEAAYLSAELLGTFLGVTRAGYGIVDSMRETITVERDWTASGLNNDKATWSFQEHGSYVDDLKRGQAVVCSNVDMDPRTVATSAARKATDALSFVSVPVLEQGQFVSLLYLHHRSARTWTPEELALVREVAQRTRATVERLRITEALKSSEAHFRGVAESMPGFLWAANAAGELDYTSRSWLEYSGDLGVESHGQGWAGYVHPQDLEGALQRWSLSLASGATYESEFRLRRRDGVYRWWLVRAVPIRNANGQRTRWIGSAADIDAIVEAREILRRSREELERLVVERTAERDRAWQLSQELLVVTDAQGIILSANSSWTQMLNWEISELVGSHFQAFTHPEDSVGATEVFSRVADAPLTTPYEFRVRHKSGSYRSVAWTAAYDGGKIYGSGRDTTAEREQAAALAQAEETLRQAQKMEAVGQLTGGIAHDFNNMLAVIGGSLELLRRRVGTSDARSTRFIEAAREGTKRASVLTQRLLAFARQQPLQPRSIDVNKLVSGMSDLLRHSLGADVQMEVVLSGGLWRTHVDPNQLENALLNLAVNARDAIPTGGKLTIETQNTHLDERYVASHLGVAPGHYVLIAITDTGAGMPKDVIAKAFDPFFTTKAVGKGTGLGLSQVYGFVKQSGGHVKIYSELAQGTTVKVYLPRLIGTMDETEKTENSQELQTGDARETVLVVEDDPAVRQFTTDALKELGYRVLESEGAEGALRTLDVHKEVSLLFTDIVMPEINGTRLAIEARRRHPTLKVLFMTGYTRNAVVHNGVLDPGVELIGKPFTLEELAAKLRSVLDCSSPR